MIDFLKLALEEVSLPLDTSLTLLAIGNAGGNSRSCVTLRDKLTDPCLRRIEPTFQTPWRSHQQSLFLQLEDAQGAPDAEAQQALRTLQEQMRNLEHAQRSASEDRSPQADGSAPSDIEIASSIDRCFPVRTLCTPFRLLCCTDCATTLCSDSRLCWQTCMQC